MDNANQQLQTGLALTKEQRLENALATGYVSINQAAEIWGKNKGTISTHVKDGKLQKRDQPLGPPKLIVAQLVEVYGDPNTHKQVKNGLNVATSQPDTTVEKTGDNRRLEATLAAKEEVIAILREQLAEARENIDRARQDADRWHTAYEEYKALPAPLPEVIIPPAPATTAATSPAAAPITVAEPPRRGLWARLTGKAA